MLKINLHLLFLRSQSVRVPLECIPELSKELLLETKDEAQNLDL